MAEIIHIDEKFYMFPIGKNDTSRPELIRIIAKFRDLVSHIVKKNDLVSHIVKKIKDDLS